MLGNHSFCATRKQPAMAKKKPKIGRPQKSASERRSVILKSRVTPPEADEISDAAAAASKSLSDWARDTLLKAARRKR